MSQIEVNLVFQLSTRRLFIIAFVLGVQQIRELSSISIASTRLERQSLERPSVDQLNACIFPAPPYVSAFHEKDFCQLMILSLGQSLPKMRDT